MKTEVVIPTPDASRNIPGFEKYYSKGFQMPTSFIKFSTLLEECIGPLYNMDELDKKWLQDKSKAFIKPDFFESIMAELEKNDGGKVI